MPEVEVYWASGSPYAWRVLLALELKGIPYVGHLLSFSARDQKAPAYLALNPRGKVPTLRVGDTVIHESVAILAWLDRAYPETPLLGADPKSAARILTRVMEVENYAQPAFTRYVRPLFMGQAEAQAADIEAAIPAIQAELATWEGWAGQAWLAGDALSGVDVMVLPALELLLRAHGKPGAERFDLKLGSLADAFPNLARWHARFRALPAYDAVYPPHWRA